MCHCDSDETASFCKHSPYCDVNVQQISKGRGAFSQKTERTRWANLLEIVLSLQHSDTFVAIPVSPNSWLIYSFRSSVSLECYSSLNRFVVEQLHNGHIFVRYSRETIIFIIKNSNESTPVPITVLKFKLLIDFLPSSV